MRLRGLPERVLVGSPSEDSPGLPLTEGKFRLSGDLMWQIVQLQTQFVHAYARPQRPPPFHMPSELWKELPHQRKHDGPPKTALCDQVSDFIFVSGD